MSSIDNAAFAVPQVADFSEALHKALAHAQVVKPTATIEPALKKSDFDGLFAELPRIFQPTSASDQEIPKDNQEARLRQNVVIESAARALFSGLVATLSIDSPEFVQIWNLFDLLAALADSENCDPALMFWLAEELLESQTIDGCRKTFDYLESRRERIVAKHLDKKQLIILRSCNELLRRLSRAEDTSFCGRVFIFMFQSFPLGDRSSVNLRGEYHTENVTTYEETSIDGPEEAEKMIVDMAADAEKDAKDNKSAGPKAVSFDAAKDATGNKKQLDTNALYPIFWSLQQYFSQPLKLFETDSLAKFKLGLDKTVTAFEMVEKSQKVSKSSDDTKDVPKKRKRLESDDNVESSNFNPKYLTSRDLFDLEISDLFFRRHVLVQAVITLDFLRSLNAPSKARHANISKPNASVMYSEKTLAEDDDEWAATMRKRIMEHIYYSNIYSSTDGQYVQRIVQAVTARDKGWVRWKMESCPPIERPPVSPEEFNEARNSAKRMMTSKKLRPKPMGAMNLDFLENDDPEAAMASFKDPARYKLPELAEFRAKIADDDFELGFGKTEKEKAQILEQKASKTWRALRIASSSKLAAFDSIDDWQNIEPVFEEPMEDKLPEQEEEEGESGERPENKTPLVLVGPPGVGKSTLANLLLERQPKVFEKLVQHTTRQPTAGEVDGRDYHFVDQAAFNVLQDGDQFLECHNVDGIDYGTSGRTADSIKEAGRIPLMEFDRDSVQGIKDFAYPARIILLVPGDTTNLEARLKSSGRYADDRIPDLLKAAQEQLEEAEPVPSTCDAVIINDDLEIAYTALERFIYGDEREPRKATNGVNGVDSHGQGDGDVAMGDAAAAAEATAGEDKPEEQAEANGEAV